MNEEKLIKIINQQNELLKENKQLIILQENLIKKLMNGLKEIIDEHQ